MTNPNQALSEVNSLIQNEKYDEAIQQARQLEADSVTQRPATALRALAHGLAQQKEDAFESLKRFGEPQASDKADTLLAAGSAAFLLTHMPAAIALLQAAHKRSPHDERPSRTHITVSRARASTKDRMPHPMPTNSVTAAKAKTPHTNTQRHDSLGCSDVDATAGADNRLASPESRRAKRPRRQDK